MSANANAIAKSSVWSELNAQTQTKPTIVCAMIYKISFRLQVKQWSWHLYEAATLVHGVDLWECYPYGCAFFPTLHM